MKRKVTTVKTLARWIDAEIMPDDEDSVSLTVDREWVPDTSRGLKPRTIDELGNLHGRVSRAIPDDIDFSFHFENGEVCAGIEFRDGPHAGFNRGLPVCLDRNLVESLRQFDWDDFRNQMIQGTQFHENVTDFAADFPVTLESAATVQNRHRAAIDRVSKDMAIRKPSHGLLYADEEADELEYQVRGYFKRDDLIGDMADMMTCQFTVIAIWGSGRLLPVNEVDDFKNEALDCLGPISRAKAEGRFWAATEAMAKNNF